ncbi:sugar ABC transporter ATP-binding protein, partial [Streptococcus agalactiae]
MTMGDRVAVLKDGRLQQCASPRDLYRDPANAFVAGFMGSPAMNMFTLPTQDGAVLLGGYRLPVPRSVADAA